MKENCIYLDYNATTPVLSEVAEEFRLYAVEYFANPSSAHTFGRFVRQRLEEFRKKVANFIGAEPEEVIFTSGGTESNHIAILGTVLKHEKGRILISAFEHPAVAKPVERLRDLGFEVELIPVSPEGYVDPEDVKRRIKKDTILVSVMFVNNEIGTIQPIKEIAEVCREKGVIFHTDACQACGKIQVDVKELNCDLLSLAGHKMYAPKGIGALYIRKEISILPIFLGGGQERGLRAGTEPVPLIASLAKACEILSSQLIAEADRLVYLREKLFSGLKEVFPGIYRYGIPEKTVPNTLTVSFRGINASKMLSELPQICASTGSACHDRKGSVTLSALGVDPETAQGTVRFSIGKLTTEEDVTKAIELIKEYFKR